MLFFRFEVLQSLYLILNIYYFGNIQQVLELPFFRQSTKTGCKHFVVFNHNWEWQHLWVWKAFAFFGFIRLTEKKRLWRWKKYEKKELPVRLIKRYLNKQISLGRQSGLVSQLQLVHLFSVQTQPEAHKTNNLWTSLQWRILFLEILFKVPRLRRWQKKDHKAANDGCPREKGSGKPKKPSWLWEPQTRRSFADSENKNKSIL